MRSFTESRGTAADNGRRLCRKGAASPVTSRISKQLHGHGFYENSDDRRNKSAPVQRRSHGLQHQIGSFQRRGVLPRSHRLSPLHTLVNLFLLILLHVFCGRQEYASQSSREGGDGRVRRSGCCCCSDSVLEKPGFCRDSATLRHQQQWQRRRRYRVHAHGVRKPDQLRPSVIADQLLHAAKTARFDLFRSSNDTRQTVCFSSGEFSRKPEDIFGSTLVPDAVRCTTDTFGTATR